MLKRALILSVLALAQAGCSIDEGEGPYKFTPLTSEARQRLEGLKRDFLKIEFSNLVVDQSLLGTEESRPTSRLAMPMGRSPIAALSGSTLVSTAMFSCTTPLVGKELSTTANQVFGWA
mgnify:CR=1 FL=1